MKKFQLRRASFRKWVENFSPISTIGYTNSACDCPIARYIEHKLGNPYAYVAVTNYKYRVSNQHSKLPSWARAIVSRVDASTHAGQPVSAKDVLKYLDETP